MGMVNAPFSGGLNITNNVTATNLSTVTLALRPGSLSRPWASSRRRGTISCTGRITSRTPISPAARTSSVQRTLTARYGADRPLAYVGTRGLHLQLFPDINQPVPGPGAAACA